MKYILLTAAFAISLLTAWQSTAEHSNDTASTNPPASVQMPVGRPSS